MRTDLWAAGFWSDEDVCVEREREAANGCGDLELLASMMEERRGGEERTEGEERRGGEERTEGEERRRNRGREKVKSFEESLLASDEVMQMKC